MKAEFGPYAAVAFAPLLLIGMNIVYALSAYTFGKLSDSMSHAKLLALGLAVLIGADLALAYSNHWTWVWAGISLWGLHMGITQGLLATMVADTAPADLRGTAYGFFNLMTERPCHARRQRAGRAAVGPVRRLIHLLRRGALQRSGPGSRPAPARHGVAPGPIRRSSAATR